MASTGELRDMRESDIRKALLERLTVSETKKDPLARIQEEVELRLGAARIDVAVFNGKIHGFEIKSADDTLDRLPSQIGVYNQVFEYMTLVVAGKHCERAMSLIPSWWEVLVPRQQKNGAIRFEKARPGQRNPQTIPIAQAEWLWKEEILEILDKKGLANGVRSKPKRILWKVLSEKLSRRDLSAAIRTSMKQRPSRRAVTLSS